MAVTGLNRPHVRTIAEFRKRNLVALSDLFGKHPAWLPLPITHIVGRRRL
jgi:hypothetical protein